MSKKTKKSRKTHPETDSVYLLKLVLYVLIGSVWIRLGIGLQELPLPLGLLVGIYFTRHEALQIDRKIEYAVLIMSAFLGYWFVPGITIAIN